jgi:hypothetical protein
MAEEKFETNLLRLIAVELHYANLMRAAQEKYGKTYLDLEQQEQATLHGALQNHIAELFRLLTPELLSSPGSTGGPLSGTPISNKPQ